ncbi:hypothetical protein SAMN02745671_02433 [Anaerovibrio lipolyticus DSM 3074]|uniref:Uncharacterized protein n=2 Tax=Anaerovibrio lipolyticus TaxID=82374 RepID=A0A0B2JT83_9FIRM|nr:hypothetical protein [Anaerovibrio lipolyticus]KHM50919.1 hypothetical protein NZ47_11930 [Anaerovibrio lipolyticus]SHJ02327.1 hypothetical protein SAMN02745671_02433 [Anaerovibrio lipolyticus DSM 3074]
MFELDLKAFVWMCIGAGGVLAVMVIMGLCKVSGRISRIEEEMEDHDRLMVENWNKRFTGNGKPVEMYKDKSHEYTRE